MAQKKYVSLSKLSTFLDNLKNKFSPITHKHTISDITDYKVDTALSSTSTNPVQNKVIDAEFEAISTAMNALDSAIDDKAASNHNHDSSYDVKGAAADALTSAQEYTDTAVGELNDGFSNVIYQMYGNDITENGAPTIRQIANDEATTAVSSKADKNHTHDDRYYTETEIDTKLAGKSDTSHKHDSLYDVKGAAAAVQTNLNEVGDTLGSHTGNTDIHVTTTNKSNWNTAYTHSQSAHARTDATKVVDSTTNGNILINGTETNVYSHPNSGVTAGTYKSVTVNAQGHITGGTNPTTLAGYGITDAETKGAASSALADAKEYTDTVASGKSDTSHNHDTAYDAKGSASSALASAKTYADSAATTAANKVKNDLLNGAGTAYDTLKELGDLIGDNADAIDALETVAAGKADKTHSHAIADVSGLQTALDGKAASSHGTHVSYSTTAPVMDGTASVGTASTVARSDHKHPTDTSRASKTEFDTHAANTTAHITSTERSNWNAAKTHADSAHAPSNAEKNQNAFSNITVGSTTVAADTTTDTVTFVGSNVTITPDATNDKITFAVANGSTSAKGIVQLTNSTSSTSTTTAATPSSVKSAYDLANTAKTNAATAQTKADSAYTLAESKVDSLSDLGITATATELNYVDGVTSNVQTQLDAKQATITGGASTIASSNLTTNRALISNGSGKVVVSAVTSTELGYLDGVTSNIQTQFSGKADKTAGVFYIEGGGTTDTTNKVATWTGSHTDIASYYNGLTIAYKIGTAGSTTTTLNINNLGAVAVVRNVTTGISTAYAVNSIVFLTYTTDSSGTSYWKTADYDANTRNTVGDYRKNDTKLYFVGSASSDSATSSSYATSYTNSNIYVNTSNVLYSAKGFSGDLTGNADSATTLTGLTATIAELNKLDGVTATTTELNYMDGVTSNVQTQLNDKISASDAASTYALQSDFDVLQDAVDNVSLAISAKEQLYPEFADTLEECTDTSKMYVLPDGYIYAYMNVGTGEGHTNQIPISTDTDGTIYSGVGYKTNYYLSSSNGAPSGKSGYNTTGFIPIGYGSSRTAVEEQVIRLKNIEALPTDSSVRVAFYDTNKTFLGLTAASNMVATPTDSKANYELDENGYINYIDISAVTGYMVHNSGKAAICYFRISAPGIDDESIITVNEEITDITSGYAWLNTGHAFVPIDYEDRIIDLEADAIALKQKVSNMETNVVPSYIQAEAKRVAQQIQSVRTAKTLVFPVMTDLHLYDGNSDHDASLVSAKYAGMGIQEINKLIHTDFTALLGDYSYGASTYTVNQVKADMTAVKKVLALDGNKEVWCIGNHDINYGAGRDRTLTLDELYAHIGANSDGVKPYANIERGYGYLDFDNQRIRVIFLNTCDASDFAVTAGSSAPCEWISPTQMRWLIDSALDFSDKDNAADWGIVVVGHHPLHYGYKCFGQCMEILEAYRDGTAGTVNNVIDGVTHTVSFDFSGQNKRAEIICNIHGHNHNCGMSQISSTSWNPTGTQLTPWLWRLCIPNICANRYNEAATNSNETFRNNYGEFDTSGNPVYWTKETGTAKATSFCTISVDRTNRKVYAHIFGAGYDREISY